MSERNDGEAVLAFLVGGVIGAGLALLFAPASGEETREKIGDWMQTTKQKGGEFFAEQREKLAAQKEALDAAFKAGKKAYLDKADS